jgi:hypothetical protein
MTLLNTASFRDDLAAVVGDTKVKLDIVAAFLTSEGLSFVLNRLDQTVQVRVVVRWRLADLVAGSSDLQSYVTLSEHGIPFYVHSDLHAKVITSDDETILIGSANLTARGLGLGGVTGNLELGIKTTPAPKDLAYIDSIFTSAVLMTPALFREISECVNAVGASDGFQEFPARIRLQLKPDVTGLWVRDLLWSNGRGGSPSDDEDLEHDITLVGFPYGSSVSPEVEKRFCELDAVAWLIQKLRANDGELYFGSLTSLLHDSLLEDPKPYRKDVKTLVSNLLLWCAHMLPHMIVIDVPGHSQRVRLLSEGPRQAPQDYWLSKILQLKQDHDQRTWGNETLFASPHKPLLLLVVLEAIYRGEFNEAVISLTTQIAADFGHCWSLVLPSVSVGDPFLPFVHLSNDGVWELLDEHGNTLNPMGARALSVSRRRLVSVKIHESLIACARTDSFHLRVVDAVPRHYFDSNAAALLKARLVTQAEQNGSS